MNKKKRIILNSYRWILFCTNTRVTFYEIRPADGIVKKKERKKGRRKTKKKQKRKRKKIRIPTGDDNIKGIRLL